MQHCLEILLKLVVSYGVLTYYRMILSFNNLQGVVLKILAAIGIIQSHHFWLDVEHINEAIQNVLICLEMVVFSVLQQYAYHVAPYNGDVETKMRVNKKNE